MFHSHCLVKNKDPIFAVQSFLERKLLVCKCFYCLYKANCHLFVCGKQTLPLCKYLPEIYSESNILVMYSETVILSNINVGARDSDSNLTPINVEASANDKEGAPAAH